MIFMSEDNANPLDAAISIRPVSPKILVVDDDHVTRQLVSRMIEGLGFQVETANGGIPAMHYLNQSEYDVLVTDLQMPDMDGYALSG